MEIKQCPYCLRAYDQDKRIAKQLPCNCVSCLKCIKAAYQFSQEIKCRNHQQIYKIKPEEFQNCLTEVQCLELQRDLSYQIQNNDQVNWLKKAYAENQDNYKKLINSKNDSQKLFKLVFSQVYQQILKILKRTLKSNINQIGHYINQLNSITHSMQQNECQTYLSQQQASFRQQQLNELQIQLQILIKEIEELQELQEQAIEQNKFKLMIQDQILNLFSFLKQQINGQLLTEDKALQLIGLYFQQNQFQDKIRTSQKIEKSINFSEEERKETLQAHSKQLNEQLKFQQSQENQEIQDFNNITIDKLKWFLNQIKNENICIQSLKQNLMNKPGLIEQTSILLQLSSINDKVLNKKLSQIIDLAKQSQEIEQAAANAITLLNYMNIKLYSQDLSGINFANADLSDTIFKNCDFSNSNFQDCNLRNTKFINCTLNNSNFTQITNEQPHIIQGHTSYVTSLVISPDNNFIISGSSDNTIKIWDFISGQLKSTLLGHIGSVYSVAVSNDQK